MCVPTRQMEESIWHVKSAVIRLSQPAKAPRKVGVQVTGKVILLVDTFGGLGSDGKAPFHAGYDKNRAECHLVRLSVQFEI